MSKDIHHSCKCTGQNFTFEEWGEYLHLEDRPEIVHQYKEFGFNIFDVCLTPNVKIIVSPILYWTDDDVWTFLNTNNIEYCSLYDNGYRRIGCICCPMSSFKQKVREIKDYPHVKKNWIKVCAKLKEKGLARHNSTPDDIFDWWISGKSYKMWYAEKYLQQKINFEE